MTHRHLKEELTCPICMELFRQPRRLPCGHSYCHTCLKAMLAQCSEDRGLYLPYSLSLVCPECREEISLDYGSGVEAIPPDFKLSKLVDLFKFMKKNDSSDSSGDESLDRHPVPCAVTSSPSRNSVTTATSVSVLVTNLPATLSSQRANLPTSPVTRPLLVTSVYIEPTQPQTVATSIISLSAPPQIAPTSVASSPSHPHTATILVSSSVTHPHIATTSVASSPTHPHIATTPIASQSQIPSSLANPPTHHHISHTSGPDVCTDILSPPTHPQVQCSNGQLSPESTAVALASSSTTSGPAVGHSSFVEHHNVQPAAMNTRSGDVSEYPTHPGITSNIGDTNEYPTHPGITSNIGDTNENHLTTTGGSPSYLLPSDTALRGSPSYLLPSDTALRGSPSYLLPSDTALRGSPSNLSPSDTASRGSRSNLSPSDTTSITTRSTPERANNQPRPSSAESRLLPERNVPLFNTAILSDKNMDPDGRRTNSIGNEDLNCYFELGAVGGLTTNGRSRNSLPSRVEHNGDSSEILSHWVNENHFYSQSCHNVSQLSDLLPVEGAEAQSFHENSPCGASREGDRTTRAQSVPSESRELRRLEEDGRSVENVALKGPPNVKVRKARRGMFSRLMDSDSSSDSSESDRRADRRSAGKPKRWLMTRFLRSVILSESSSSDYSDDDAGGAVGNKATNSQNTAEKTDTHFSSAISSTPQSRLMADQTHSPQTGVLQAVSTQMPCKIENSENKPEHGINSNPGHHGTLKNKTQEELLEQSQAESKRQNLSISSTREHTRSEVSGPPFHSAGSTTSPKELTSQTGSSQSVDSTQPKAIHTSQSYTEITNGAQPFLTTTSLNSNSDTLIPHLSNDPQFTGKQCRQTTKNKIDQSNSALPNVGSMPTFYDNLSVRKNKPRCDNLPNVGSPPTFYDNVTVIPSDRENKTRCDNLSNPGSPPTFYDNVNRYDNAGYRRVDGVDREGSAYVSSVNPCNDPLFEPSIHPHSSSRTSGPYEARTFYDNLSNSHTRPMQTLLRLHRNHTHPRNPVTDIEELKTGYEHVQLEYEGDNNGDQDANAAEVSDRTEQHMGELNDSARWYSNQIFQASPNTKPSSRVSARGNHSPANHAIVNSGHPSFYDNISNSVYDYHPQYSTPAVSNAGASRENSDALAPNKTERLTQRQRILNSDFIPERHHNVQHVANNSGRSSEDLRFIDNYFDQYSQNFRRGGSSDQNSSSPIISTIEDDVCQRRTASAPEAVVATVLSVDDISSNATRDVQNSALSGAPTKEDNASERTESARNAAEALPETGSCSTTTRNAVTNTSASSNSAEGLSNSGNSEAGSLSDTSMQNNRKKPQSRLKKFFTSLLSLSSSDNGDDENFHRSSSSDSSDW